MATQLFLFSVDIFQTDFPLLFSSLVIYLWSYRPKMVYLHFLEKITPIILSMRLIFQSRIIVLFKFGLGFLVMQVGAEFYLDSLSASIFDFRCQSSSLNRTYCYLVVGCLSSIPQRAFMDDFIIYFISAFPKISSKFNSASLFYSLTTFFQSFDIGGSKGFFFIYCDCLLNSFFIYSDILRVLKQGYSFLTLFYMTFSLNSMFSSRSWVFTDFCRNLLLSSFKKSLFFAMPPFDSSC